MATSSVQRAAIDLALSQWRQGDCVLGTHWFIFGVEPDTPLTSEAEEAGGDIVAAEVRGLMVATQSCDLVRRCEERPFVEVCPLVVVGDQALQEVARGRRPNYAFVPGTASDRLVADLDRVMTVEKGVVATWTRLPGCRTDHERRSMAFALARKRARPAFPDDFVQFVGPLQKRLVEKHDKASDEGKALRSLREVRVSASPNWSEGDVTLMFWFIRGDAMPTFEGHRWDELLIAWMNLIPSSGRFRVHGAVQTLGDLTAADYVASDALDLEYLSQREES